MFRKEMEPIDKGVNVLSSSHKAHPWPEDLPPARRIAWGLPMRAPPLPSALHYGLESRRIGKGASKAGLSYDLYQLAAPSSRTRYMSVPLQTQMSNRSFISSAPVSSVGGFDLPSETQRVILDNAADTFGASLAAAGSEAKASTAFRPFTPMPGRYSTSSSLNFPSHSAGAREQQQVRTFTTSPLVKGVMDRIGSAPMRAEVPSLSDSQFCETRFWSLRDSDGTTRQMEVTAPGTAPPPAPTPAGSFLLRKPASTKYLTLPLTSEYMDSYQWTEAM